MNSLVLSLEGLRCVYTLSQGGLHWQWPIKFQSFCEPLWCPSFHPILHPQTTWPGSATQCEQLGRKSGGGVPSPCQFIALLMNCDRAHPSQCLGLLSLVGRPHSGDTQVSFRERVYLLLRGLPGPQIVEHPLVECPSLGHSRARFLP